MLDEAQRSTVETLEAQLGHTFTDGSLIQEALTHASFANETGAGMPNNERLEYLGDAILGLVVAHWLFELHPDRPEGQLTQMRSRLVRTGALASLAAELDLGNALLMGVGEERTGGRVRRSLLADGMEAVLGALYLDGGFGVADQVIRALLQSRMEALEGGPPRDMKSKLQEWAQATLKVTPVYRIVSTTGPAHEANFEAVVQVGSEMTASGSSGSKQGAEKEAARMALQQLGLEA